MIQEPHDSSTLVSRGHTLLQNRVWPRETSSTLAYNYVTSKLYTPSLDYSNYIQKTYQMLYKGLSHDKPSL